MNQKIAWLISGLLLAGLFLSMSLIPNDIERKSAQEAHYLITIIAMQLASGAIYFLTFILLPRSQPTKGLLGWIIAIALLSRLAFLTFTPPIEDDYHRYLWDGAQTAHAINPYTHSPQTILNSEISTPLIEQGKPTLTQINHPHLRTLYPPIAQAAFAAAYCLSPFKTVGLRLVYLLFEILTVTLLILLLKRGKKPLHRLMIYAWNPLLIYEVYFNAHYDIILTTFIILFLWAITTHRFTAATFTLTLAIAAKLWPLILTPFLLLRCHTGAGRYPQQQNDQFSQKHRILQTTLLITLITITCLPFGLAIQNNDNNSGLVAYSRDWHANGWAYRPLEKLGWDVVKHFQWDLDGRFPARALVVVILITTAAFLARRKKTTTESLAFSIALIILLMILLSPTVYPWYYVSLIGLTALAPHPILLLWTLLLPLSYLKWMLPDSSQWIIIWIIHLPIWTMLLFYTWKKFRSAKAPIHVQ